MNPTAIGIVVFACTFGAALGAISLRRILPEDHLSQESRDTIKVSIGFIATMTALILGLVTASAKSSFDAVSTMVKHTAADVLSLDRVLARYGPETAQIREALKLAVANRVEVIWSLGPRHARFEPSDVAQAAERLAAQIRGLDPQTDDQQWLRSRAHDLSEAILEARWLGFAGLGTSVPVPFLTILLFWLTMTFAGFGLFAPRNATVVSALFMCALSAAGAVLLVLEMDGPFEGVITVSSDPLKYALAHMNR